jgi:Putative transposase
LSKVFRGKFVAGLKTLFAEDRLVFPPSVEQVAPLVEEANFATLMAELRRHDWVVYSKAPFAGPDKLLHYLGHYTHRVAISNSRLISCDDGQVVFHYRDRAAGDVRKTLTLPADEFLRRFLSHVLPAGFQRIRHYGLLASRTKKLDLTRCRELLAAPKPQPPVKKTTSEWLLLLWGIDVNRCPRCGQRSLECTVLLPQRGPSPTPPSAPAAPKILDTS